MEDRFNTIAGWVLFSGIVALGLTSVSKRYFDADKDTRPIRMGYPIAGVVEEGAPAKEVPLPELLAAADVAKGAQVFKKCASCHTVDQGGANGIGPNLYHIVGDAIGQGRGGYAFSDVVKALGGSWDFDKLNHWLTSPKKMANGTKMTFAGLDGAQDRANVIVYLNSQGSNLPLPKPAAATSPAATGAAAKAPAVAGSAAPLPIATSAPKVGDNQAVGSVGRTQAH